MLLWLQGRLLRSPKSNSSAGRMEMDHTHMDRNGIVLFYRIGWMWSPGLLVRYLLQALLHPRDLGPRLKG